MSSTHSLEDVNKKVKIRGKVSSVHRGRHPAEDDKPYSRNEARNKSINRLTETYSPSLNFYPDDYEVSYDSYSADISSMSTKETKAKGKKKGGKKKGKEKDRKESNKTEENPPKSPESVEEIKVSQGNLQEKRHSSIVRKNVEGGKRSDSILSLLKNSLHSKTSLSKANADPMVQRASNVVRPPSSRQFIVTKKSVADFGCSVPGDFSNLNLSGSTNKLLRASYQAVPRQESLKLNDIATQTAPHVCRQCDDSNYLMSRQMPNEASSQGRLASLAAQEAGNTYMYSPPNRYIPEVNAPYHYQVSTTVSGGLREDLRQSIISQSRNAPHVGAERGGQANHYAAYDADKAKLLKSKKSKYICYRVPNAENNDSNTEHDMRAQLLGNKSMMNKTTSSPLINYATRAPKERDCPSNIQLDPNAYKTTTTSTSETNAAQRWSRRSQNVVENSTGPARNRTSGPMKKSNLSPPMVSFKSNDVLADQVYEVGVSRSCDSVKTLKEWNTLVARDFQHLLQLYQNFQKLSFKYKLNDDYDFVSDVGNCSILKENQNNEDVMDYSDRSDQSEDKSIVILTSDDEALSNNNECSIQESHPEKNVNKIITGLETSKEHHKLIKIFCAAKAASEVGIKVPGINSQGWVDDEFVKHLQLSRQFDVRSTINYCAIQVNLLDEDAYEYLFSYVQLYCEFLAVKRDRIGCCNYMEQYQPLLTAFKKYLDIFFTFSAAKLFREERQKIPGLDEQGFLEEGFIDYVQNSVEFNLRVMIDRCNSFPATSFSLKHVNCYIQEYLRLYNCYQADLNKKCSQLTGDMNRTQTNHRKMTFDTNCSTDKGQSDLSDCNPPETEVQLVSLQVTSCNEVYARPCVQTDNPKATNCLNQLQLQNSGVINVSYRKSQPSNASADSGCQVEHSELYSLQEETEQAPPLQAVMQHLCGPK
ncbi:hypothetical protein Bpfe_000222 [Biomphalaria pfeifferi]|uniref:Uncharacterized protein n=1 Tax=Biomphalaria pfeifferi TaxID=112525 RepID=A0AAD8CDS6_BIOPF|nr:hypothetical protein Bpfe_000222 [Biomphalaria pfeifferi]